VISSVRDFRSDPKVKKVWTDRTYCIRDQLYRCTTLVSESEKQYLDTRWTLFDSLLTSETTDEFILKASIAQCSANFQLLDYFVLIYGFGCIGYDGKAFERSICIELIDKHDFFDSAMKIPKLSEMLLGAISKSYLSSKINDFYRMALAHVFTKFPALRTMSFNYKTRTVVSKMTGKYETFRVCRFDDRQVKRWF